MLCPYRYYSTYRLKTREKKDSKPSYADDGVFLHYIFEHFLRSALQKDGSLLLPTHEAVDQIADRIIEDYLASVCPVLPEHMDKHLLHLFARLRKLATVMLHDMINELKSSRFVPTFFEKIIGGEGGLPPVVLDMKDGCRILLSGKIDRIDLYESNDKIYVRVVDYKSGSHSFRLEDVRSGLDIQLILYLFAVLSSDPARYAPGGAQYLYTANDKGRILVERSGFLISEDEVLTASDNSDGRDFTKKLLLQTAEEIADLSREMNQAIISAGERILAGEANKTPSKEACLFCPVRNCCDKAYHE
jgi:ATP-dependent helicase/DNAse subunit B